MKSFSYFLSELNEGIKSDFNIGDFVAINGKYDAITFTGEVGTITKLSYDTCRVRFDNRFNTNLHSGDGEDKSRCSYNIDYKLVELANMDPDIKRFKISQELMSMLDSIKNESVYANLILDLRTGVNKSTLINDTADYLDFEADGTISYLRPRFFDEVKGNEWKNNRRTKVRASRLLKDIYSPDYLSKTLKETDVNSFVNKWAFLCAPPEIKEYRGEEILRAYNYKKECHPGFGYTCANFFQKENNWGDHNEPTVDQYDIYVKNPENCGAVVVWEKGKIVARKSFQQGPNIIDSGKFTKDKVGTVWGNYYGMGGRDSKYDKAITDYLEKKYNAVPMTCGDTFCIKLNNTRFPYYCPFDSMYVCFKKNLLANRRPNDMRNLRWDDTYHAQCPDELL